MYLVRYIRYVLLSFTLAAQEEPAITQPIAYCISPEISPSLHFLYLVYRTLYYAPFDTPSYMRLYAYILPMLSYVIL